MLASVTILPGSDLGCGVIASRPDNFVDGDEVLQLGIVSIVPINSNNAVATLTVEDDGEGIIIIILLHLTEAHFN